MKKILVQLIAAVFMTGLFTGTALAHSIWMDVYGETTTETSTAITINVYAHADYDDALLYYAASIGFDDTALGGELTYVSYALNTAIFDEAFFNLGEYVQGGSEASAGDSWVCDIAGDYSDFDGLSVTAGSDVLLFSITFTYDTAEYDWTGDDVWIEFCSDSAGGVYWYTAEQVTDVDTLKGSADFAAVPLPSAIWLMGCGLLGLAGIRRKADK